MAGILGAVFGVLVCLLIVGSVLAVPAVVLGHCWVKARRTWRRERVEQEPRQPYDDAYERALWETAAANGARDARQAIEGL